MAAVLNGVSVRFLTGVVAAGVGFRLVPAVCVELRCFTDKTGRSGDRTRPEDLMGVLRGMGDEEGGNRLCD